jgi:hypothetical protein
MSGYWCSKNFTQAGQQEVRMGSRTDLSPFRCRVSRSSSSLPLLHDGQVGGEVRVEDVIEAHGPEGCGHLARHQGARLQAELLAQGGPDRRGGLDDHHLVRIRQGLDDLPE